MQPTRIASSTEHNRIIAIYGANYFNQHPKYLWDPIFGYIWGDEHPLIYQTVWCEHKGGPYMLWTYTQEPDILEATDKETSICRLETFRENHVFLGGVRYLSSSTLLDQIYGGWRWLISAYSQIYYLLVN